MVKHDLLAGEGCPPSPVVYVLSCLFCVSWFFGFPSATKWHDGLLPLPEPRSVGKRALLSHYRQVLVLGWLTDYFTVCRILDWYMNTISVQNWLKYCCLKKSYSCSDNKALTVSSLLFFLLTWDTGCLCERKVVMWVSVAERSQKMSNQ